MLALFSLVSSMYNWSHPASRNIGIVCKLHLRTPVKPRGRLMNNPHYSSKHRLTASFCLCQIIVGKLRWCVNDTSAIGELCFVRAAVLTHFPQSFKLNIITDNILFYRMFVLVHSCAWLCKTAHTYVVRNAARLECFFSPATCSVCFLARLCDRVQMLR